MSDPVARPEPLPAPREPARFVREIAPSPREERRAMDTCTYCKRRDGSHASRCRRKTGGRKRKPVTRRTPRAVAPATEGITVTTGVAVTTAAREQVRQRLESEITETQAYVDELRRVLAGL